VTISANRITCGWNLLLTFLNNSDTSSCSNNEGKGLEKVAEKVCDQFCGIEALENVHQPQEVIQSVLCFHV
jgi:hypothetical protein